MVEAMGTAVIRMSRIDHTGISLGLDPPNPHFRHLFKRFIDHKGDFKIHLRGNKSRSARGQYLGRVTNNVAEYNALILGLDRARELGAAKVRIFADSELMVRQLNGQYKVKNPNLQALYSKARELADSFASFTINHVPRARNTEADQMANRAIDEFEGVDDED